MKPIIVIGGGGHAAVVVDCLRLLGRKILGASTPDIKKGATVFPGLPCIGNDQTVVRDYPPATVTLVNGVGQTTGEDQRRYLYESMSSIGYDFESVVHPSANLGSRVSVSSGTQLMAGVILQVGCKVGKNSIINTGARVDHDCVIGNHVHVAPGATVCGGVYIDDGAYLGAGSVVIQGVKIGARSTIGAGVTVLRDVPPDTVFVGGR